MAIDLQVPDEFKENSDLNEFLNRLIQNVNNELSNHNWFVPRSTLPEKVVEGRVYYFSQAISGSEIIYKGYWGHDGDKWVSLMSSYDFYFEVARGNVPGHSAVQKFGEIPDIDSGDGVLTVWDNKASTLGPYGNYTPPTVAQTHDVASSVAADTGTVTSSGTATGGSTSTLEDTGATFSTDGVLVGDMLLNDTDDAIGVVTAITSETELAVAGLMRSPTSGGNSGPTNDDSDSYRVVTNASTGISIIHLQGIAVDRTSQSEFVVLNGTSNVATTNTYYRQFRGQVFGRGTTGASGDITSTAQTDATVSLRVSATRNQTMMAVYTVPIDKDAKIIQWWASLSKKGNASVIVNLWVGILDGIPYPVQPRTLNATGSSEFRHESPLPWNVPGGAEIWVTADTDTNNSGVSAGFDIVLIDKGF